MTDERWQRIQQLFDRARTCRPEERGVLLAEACGDDAALRAEVESLLTHDRRAAPEFLQPPEPGPQVRPAPAPDKPDPLVGTVVGRCRVERVIASGGMGTVYLAQQEHPHRQVALKMMRLGIASSSALRRFEYESEILARLRHPNIAQVYEAGTHPADPRRDHTGADHTGAVPYFVMEYIPDARTIIQYAGEQHLGTRQRLELFAQVCDAVHHGHQKGIIHRDLKPGNTLVDSSGQVKIIDFGVARSTDSDIAVTTMQTDTGQLLGTLQYMSPEQCAANPGDLDMRSDVYSLGVMLYELACDQLPYDVTDTTILGAARMICEHVPTRPSTIRKILRGNVEAIALKALAKDRNQRYQSAADLARDIRRHLNHEPIEARPPTAWTRALRWVAKHPLATTAALGVIVGAVAAMMSGSVIYWYRSVRPSDVRLSDDRRTAELLSVDGTVVHEWSGEHPGCIKFAQIIELAPEFRWDRLAILGFDAVQGQKHPYSLCAYDLAGSLQDPVWERHIEPSLLPSRTAKDHALHSEDFGIDKCWLFDIFEQSRGDEIVAVHAWSGSDRAIRIYAQDGTVVYQAWYDGAVGDCYWMADAGLLVFSGLNCEAYWIQRGCPEAPSPNPSVVFAIRPQFDSLSTEYLSAEPGAISRDFAWYKCLLPCDAWDRIDYWRLQAPVGQYDPRRSVSLVLVVDSELETGFAWVIDDTGEVTDAHQVGDAYSVNRLRFPEGDPRRLPDPDLFHLGPLPPITSSSGEVVNQLPTVD
ncbi:MAG: serine/threonine protein kinase [bacterium]|nr:serine/threonine protein kinase [bacterium]